VDALPEGDRVCGVTSLGDEIYVLRWKNTESAAQMEVYGVASCRFLRRVNLPDAAGGFTDMAACEHHRCVYASDHVLRCDTIRYDTRCYFNVRSKADISQLNLPHGTDN